jgi:hypothetical protein
VSYQAALRSVHAPGADGMPLGELCRSRRQFHVKQRPQMNRTPGRYDACCLWDATRALRSDQATAACASSVAISTWVRPAGWPTARLVSTGDRAFGRVRPQPVVAHRPCSTGRSSWPRPAVVLEMDAPGRKFVAPVGLVTVAPPAWLAEVRLLDRSTRSPQPARKVPQAPFHVKHAVQPRAGLRPVVRGWPLLPS